MKLEHKIGIAVTCTFLCLTGAVIGLKMQDQPVPTVKEQVASEGKGHTNLIVPPFEGATPLDNSSAPGGEPQGSKEAQKTLDGSASVKSLDKPNPTKTPTDPMLDLGSNDRPTFQPPPSGPQPTAAGSGDGPEKKKQLPRKVEEADVSTSGPTTDANNQAKGQVKGDKEAEKEQNRAKNATGGMYLLGNPGQSTGSTSASSPSSRDVQKAGGTGTNTRGGIPPTASSSEGKADTASASEKDQSKNQATLNNASGSNPNTSAAPYLPGSSSTGGTSRPATPAPAPPPKPNIIPIGDFEGSQPTPPTSGAPTLQPDKDKSPIPPSSSTSGGAGTSAPPPPNRSMDTEKPSGKMDSISGQANLSLTSPSKPSDPKAGDGKPAPSLMQSGEKGNEDKFTSSPPPAPPSPMMDKLPDNKTAPAPAPPGPASPPAPASKPADNSYFIPESHSTAGSSSKSTAGSGDRSTAAPPGLLPYPEMPGSPPPSSPSGTDRAKPIATGGAATAPQAIARPQPQVIVYDEQEYRAAAGDTFEKISAKYYGTDKFAEALRRHNRHHARASLQMTNEGSLVPGERLYIPPADILEQRYGDTIVKPSSPSQTVPASFKSPSPPSGK